MQFEKRSNKEAKNQKEAANMKTQMKVKGWVVGLLMMGLMVLGMGKAAEASSTDSIVLLVTPVVNMSVTITSPTANIGYDFSGVDLGATSQAGTPATVTNTGNIAAQWSLRANGLDNWTNGTSVATDRAVLQALFGQPTGAYPSTAQFDSVDSTMTTTTQTSQSDVRYSTGGIMGVSIPPSGPDFRLLWFRIKMPPESSYTPQQKFRMFVVAGSAQ